jgi:membrane protein YdbS with pleckstrin-like domain
MHSNSHSMHVIAGLSLLLIPVASMAALIQTPFFLVEEQNQMQVHLSIGAFLAISAFVTVLIIAVWWLLRWSWERSRNERMGRAAKLITQ